jgi:hypothetical protein
VALNLRYLSSLLAFALAVSAQADQNGCVGGIIPTSEEDPLFVSEDIVIPSGEEGTAGEASIIRFHASTGVSSLADTDSLKLRTGHAGVAWRRPLSMAAVALGIAGGGGGVGYACFREREFHALYYDDENTPGEFDYYHERQQTWRNYAVIAGTAGGTVFLAGVVLLVADHLTEKRAAVAVVPRLGRESGFCVTIPLGSGK